MGRPGAGARTSALVFLAPLVHSLPEGLADRDRLRLRSRRPATSAPQPIGAPIAYGAVEEVQALLPLSFAFAAGAMLALIVLEMLPSAYEAGRRVAPSAGLLAGALTMFAISRLVGV